jgi:hypothetical protein
MLVACKAHPTDTCAKGAGVHLRMVPGDWKGETSLIVAMVEEGQRLRATSGTGALSVGEGGNASRERGHGNIGAKTRWVTCSSWVEGRVHLSPWMNPTGTRDGRGGVQKALRGWGDWSPLSEKGILVQTGRADTAQDDTRL